jgi:hypothetical protein
MLASLSLGWITASNLAYSAGWDTILSCAVDLADGEPGLISGRSMETVAHGLCP